MSTSDEERLVRVRVRQTRDSELCRGLVGMSAVEATAVVEQLGYEVRSAVIGSDAVFTADMRTDRVNLFLSPDQLVVRADVY